MARLAVILVLLLLACAKPVETAAPVKTPPVPDAPIRTDRSSYVLTDGPQGPEATIVATLRAPADRAVHIVNCNGASSTGLQRKVGEEWVDAWAIAINGCLSPPIVVPPGGEHTARIYLHERSGGVIDPPGREMIESGTYRVMWFGIEPELPLEQRVSAPIAIEVPAGPAKV